MILKLITRKGRQALVRDIIAEKLTPRFIAEVAANGVSRALAAGTGKLDEKRLRTIVHGTAAIADAAGRIADAVNPDGAGGTTITDDERTAIVGTLQAGLGMCITQSAIDAAAERLVALVP